MKLKKSIAILIPCLHFSLFAYADPSPNYLILPLFLGFCQLVSVLLFIISFFRRYVTKNHTANKWIYISSFITSSILIWELSLEFEDHGISKPFIILTSILIFLVIVSIITYKKSITKAEN